MTALVRRTAGSARLGALVVVTLLASACGGGSKAKSSTVSSQSCTGAACGAPTVPSAPASSSLSLSCASLTVAKGTGTTCTAWLLFADGSKQDVTGTASWSSSDPAVARVSAGAVTGAGVGSATLSATAGGQTGSASVTVTAAVLTALSAGPDLQTLPVGVQFAYDAVGIFSDGTQQDLTAQVAWTSADREVATVSAAGVATAVGQGTTSLSAAFGGLTASVSLSVTAAALQSLDVFADLTAIAKGTSVDLVAQGNYSDGTTQDLTAQAAWSSSGDAATLSSGNGQELAFGAAVGTDTVTATVSGISGSIDLTVTPAALVSIAVVPPAASLPVGLTQQLVATGTFTDASTQDLTTQAAWSSSDPTVAAVSNDVGTAGMVSGLKQGAVTVTAAALGVSGGAAVTVSAAVLQSISVTPATATMPSGYQVQFQATASFSDGSSRDVTTRAIWTSSNPSVAVVSTSGPTPGLATGESVGTATIQATIGGMAGGAALQVTNARLSSLAVAPSPFTVAVKGRQSLVATGTFSDGSTLDVTRQCNWTSSAKSIAWVTKAGVVTGMSPGSVTINVRRGPVRLQGGVPGTVQ